MVLEKLIIILINMSFLTLLERKFLGYSQLRKGPNKVSILGLLQPIADAIKLFLKEKFFPILSQNFFFILIPGFFLLLACSSWSLLLSKTDPSNIKFNLLLMVAIISTGVYLVLSSSWFSNSKYSTLGGLRSMAQTISYEVSLFLIIFFPLLTLMSFNMKSFSISMNLNPPIFMFPIMFLFWIIISSAELNRAPFDFAEGESELVSGFNTEFSSFYFTLIFMAEYLMILFISCWSMALFMNLKFFFMMILFASIIILIRSAYPRLRYDSLMNLAWKSILAVSISFIILPLLSI